MNKKEFLDILYEQLIDQLPPDRASAHIQYYQSYIEEELRKGLTSDEIFQKLGDPRLIAKTLIDTETESVSKSQVIDEQTNRGSESSEIPRHHHYRLDLSTWYGKLIVILAAAVAVALLFMVLSFMIPFLLAAAVILFLISWIRKRR